MRACVGILVAGAVGCGTPPAPLAPRAPEYQPDQQTKSRVRANPLEPLVVEWPAAARAQLEAQARRGVVAVRYDGETMEVLTDCAVEGRYAYAATNVHRDRLVIGNADELAAHLPLGVASLRGKLEQTGRLEVSLTVVGAYVLEGARDAVEVAETAGCKGATHFVTALTAGAFELSTGAAGAASVGADVGPTAGADASHRESRDVINRAGDQTACNTSRPDDAAPPVGCGALVRVVLAAVRPKMAPVPPPVAVDAAPITPTPTEPDVAQAPPSDVEPRPPLAATSEAAAPRQDPAEPPPMMSDSAPPRSEGWSGWTYVGVAAGALAVVGLVVLGVVAAANSQPPPRDPAPTGGLGSVQLSQRGIVSW